MPPRGVCWIALAMRLSSARPSESGSKLHDSTSTFVRRLIPATALCSAKASTLSMSQFGTHTHREWVRTVQPFSAALRRFQRVGADRFNLFQQLFDGLSGCGPVQPFSAALPRFHPDVLSRAGRTPGLAVSYPVAPVHFPLWVASLRSGYEPHGPLLLPSVPRQ
ncbi:MAG: hypothetical protein K0S36_2565 [Nitrosospira multiformis]|nr:hypothetical protein [Nitrosospira multiformis]